MQSTSESSLPLRSIVTPWPRTALVWLASLGLGALAVWTVYGARPGLGWSLFALGLAAATLAVERPSLRELTAPRYQAIGLLVLLSAAEAITADGGDQFLLLVGIGWLGAVSVACAATRSTRPGIGRLVVAPFAAPLRVTRSAAEAIGSGVRSAGSEESAPLLRGALLALACVAILGALLGEADPTLGAARDAVFRLIVGLDGIGRIAFFALVAFAVLGFLHRTSRGAGREDDEPQAGARRHTDLERLIVVGSVAALFATFLALQLASLFGNPGARTGSGVTLAQAVHRGFTEISVVVALTSAIIALLERGAVRGPRERWVRAVEFAVIGACLLLLASAYFRLSQYELAYGYTAFRMYVRLYIGALAIVSILLGHELIVGIDVDRYCWRAAVTFLATLAILGFWNYPAWIVRANVERYVQSGQIDLRYLARTGPNGIPALVESLGYLGPDERRALAPVVAPERSDGGSHGSPGRPWYEWNLRRTQADTAVTEHARDPR